MHNQAARRRAGVKKAFGVVDEYKVWKGYRAKVY